MRRSTILSRLPAIAAVLVVLSYPVAEAVAGLGARESCELPPCLRARRPLTGGCALPPLCLYSFADFPTATRR